MAEINVTPMVDVMLVLLIIFMVAAPLMTSSIDIDLPVASGGKLVDQDSSSITLTKPILLVAQMMPNGQAALQFAPFMVGTDEDNKYVIARSALSVLPMKARKEIADNYLQATSSIVPAGAGLVV